MKKFDMVDAKTMTTPMTKTTALDPDEDVGYADADYAGCRVNRKSTSSLYCFLGSSLVCWSSRKQTSVANSTTEAEYIAATSCCSQIQWMTHSMRDFGLIFKSVPLFCDNTSAISLAKNLCFYGKVKHIEVRHHLRQC